MRVHTRRGLPPLRAAIAPALLALCACAVHAESLCRGTVSKGSIEGSVKLPVRGPNFSAYSTLSAALGRTHVHSKVAEVVAASYEAVRVTRPDTVFVYGETGWPWGGPFRPHRTHQNGLSVDFFVPVLDVAGRSVPLPTGPGNRFGYDIEFDANGRYETYRIDFPALAEHLYQLHAAGRTRGVGISLVILDADFLPKLFATPRGEELRRVIPFMKGKPWVRHDEHYHVDFSVACKAA